MKYLVYGKITRTNDEGSRVVAEGSIVKEGESIDKLKRDWYTAMKQLFRATGPRETIDFYCRVVPVPVAAPPPPETEAAANAFDRPAGFPRASDNVALDTIFQARHGFQGKRTRGALRNMAAVAWSNILDIILGGRRA